MRSVIIALVCAVICGCTTARKPNARGSLRAVDPILGREQKVREFERRLDELGAQIDVGAVPEERIATIVIPGRPGYFPPRTVKVVYVITDHGLVVVKSTDITSFGSKFAEQKPNKAPEPTPGLVTSRAEMASEVISSGKARLAPSPVVAHL